MIYTISDLQAGRVAVVNDGTLQQLTDVMGRIVFGFSNFYCFCGDKICCSNDTPDLPTQSVSLFSLREEPQERDSLRWEQEIWDAARLHNYIDGTLIGVGNGYRYATLREYLNSKVARNI